MTIPKEIVEKMKQVNSLMETHEYIELKSDDLDMMVELVDAKVDWHYVES